MNAVKELTEWEEDCMKWRNKILVGKKAHWCPDWDFLPVDETTPEIDCCYCTFETPPKEKP